MARQPPKTLLRALLTTKVGEDSLTDGLAYLLASDAEVLQAFASSLLKLDGDWRYVSACTQLAVPDGRVDLELVLTNGARKWLVWIEAETFTRDHDDQLSVYEREQPHRAAARLAADAHEIVTLAPFGNAIEAVSKGRGFRHLTWQQVLTTIALVAERESAHARELRDYIWRLENREVAVDVSPVDGADEHVAARAEALLNPHGVIGELVGAAAQVDGFEPGARYSDPRGRLALTVGVTLEPREVPACWHFEPAPVSVRIQVWFSTKDSASCEAIDHPRPAFLAGVVFGDDDATPLPDAVRGALTDPRWSHPEGVHLGLTDYEQIWLVGVRPLSELGALTTLADQLQSMREWSTKTIAAVLGAGSPPAWRRNVCT